MSKKHIRILTQSMLIVHHNISKHMYKQTRDLQVAALESNLASQLSPILYKLVFVQDQQVYCSSLEGAYPCFLEGGYPCFLLHQFWSA